MPSIKDKNALWNVCQKFIDKNDIGSDEVIYQCDNVILNAHDFIKEICDIVGYKKYEEIE